LIRGTARLLPARGNRKNPDSLFMIGLTRFCFAPTAIIHEQHTHTLRRLRAGSWPLLLWPLTMSTLCKPQKINSVSCDSGSIYIVDPCHLENPSSIPGNGPFYFGASFNTEIGDGEFNIYEQRDIKGHLRRIVIEID